MSFAQFFGPHRTADRGAVTVFEYERGLLYVRGAFRRVLPPGRYRLWPFTHRRIVVIDTRRATVQIVNQKLLTADQITVTLNVVADYEVSDPDAAVHRVADFRGQLYEDVQLAVRNVVGSEPVDALLQERARTNARILEAVQPPAEAYGVRVLSVGIKDIILAPRVRDLLMENAERFGTPVDMALQAGEISVHADLLLHGSGANESDRRRCGLTLRYTPGEVRAYMGWQEKGVVVAGEPPPHWANRPRPQEE